MATIELTDANFSEVTSGEGIVLVDFWADWCIPCKRFAPTYERVSELHPDVVFGKLDTEANPATQAEFQIRTIPTIMIIRDGVLVHQEAGVMPQSKLEAYIKQVRELDMDEVRAKLAA
ncbi:thioredoxin [Luedemannella flava]|uniref:Thioredoxin n=1 Tax=Luedemannella flava TaxID=349316 RepID=A0ABN2LVA6_9ACTN